MIVDQTRRHACFDVSSLNYFASPATEKNVQIIFFSGLKECGRGFFPFSPGFFLYVYLISIFLEFGYFVSNQYR